MSALSLLVTFCLFALGLIFTLYLGGLLLQPFLRLYVGSQGSLRLKRAMARVEIADGLLAEHKCLEALQELRQSILLDVPRALVHVETMREHNQTVLSRCLVVQEELQSKAENLASVEKLLSERADLLGLLIRAEESFGSLKTRREQAGKKTPSWSKGDYQQKVKDIRDALKKNESDILPALERLFSSLAVPASDSIVYH